MVRVPLRIEYALLGFFRDGPSYPYRVHRELQESEVYRLVWYLKQRQTYALLDRLVEEGLLQRSSEPQQRGPTRQMLRLTDSGREAFHTWVRTPVEHGRDFRQEFLTKLFWAVREDGQVREQLIFAQQVTMQQRLRRLQREAAEPANRGELDRLVFRYRIGQLTAVLDWLEQCKGSGAA